MDAVIVCDGQSLLFDLADRVDREIIADRLEEVGRDLEANVLRLPVGNYLPGSEKGENKATSAGDGIFSVTVTAAQAYVYISGGSYTGGMYVYPRRVDGKHSVLMYACCLYVGSANKETETENLKNISRLMLNIGIPDVPKKLLQLLTGATGGNHAQAERRATP